MLLFEYFNEHRADLNMYRVSSGGNQNKSNDYSIDFGA